MFTSNVTPSLASFDHADVLVGDSVSGPNHGDAARVTADSQNLLGSELGASGALAPSGVRAVSSLGHHVGAVVSRGPKKQMVGIDAGAHIALVTDPHPVGDRSVRKLPCYPMRGVVSAFPPNLTVTSRSADTTGPQHAAVLIGRRRVVPESLGQRPMTGNKKPFILGGSHISTSNAVIGQGRCRRLRVARPAHSTTTARNGHSSHSGESAHG